MDNQIKLYRVSAIVLLCITGLNAFIAGFLFIIEPSGKWMGMTTSYLSASPFTTFLIPGIILLVVNGVLNILAAAFAIKKYKNYPFFVVIQGILLSGWILIQVILVDDFNLLHYIMFAIGVLLVVFGMLLSKNCKP